VKQAEESKNRALRPSNAELKASGEPCIEIENITLRYNEQVLLERFSLNIFKGEKVVLTGPSGRGKTTILRSILGFVVPTEGSIRVLGQPIQPSTVWNLRTFMGYVPQEPELGSGTVRAWLERPFTFKVNKAIRDNLKKIPELFRQFFLPIDLLDKDVQVLSGGEKQRVAIISALLLERSILLLDEPTSALDDLSKKRLVEFLGQKKGLTALVVSHDASILSIADRVIDLS